MDLRSLIFQDPSLSDPLLAIGDIPVRQFLSRPSGTAAESMSKKGKFNRAPTPAKADLATKEEKEDPPMQSDDEGEDTSTDPSIDKTNVAKVNILKDKLSATKSKKSWPETWDRKLFGLLEYPWYTIPAAVCKDTAESRNIPRGVLKDLTKMWYEDSWAHLSNPEPWVTLEYFAIAVPPSINNTEMRAKMTSAHWNLRFAQYRSNPTEQTLETLTSEYFNKCSFEAADMYSLVHSLSQHIRLAAGQVTSATEVTVASCFRFEQALMEAMENIAIHTDDMARTLSQKMEQVVKGMKDMNLGDDAQTGSIMVGTPMAQQVYIAGFVVKMMLRKITCDVCKGAILANLFQRKKYGRLKEASLDVVRVQEIQRGS